MLKDLNKDGHQEMTFNEFYEMMHQIVYSEIATTSNQAVSNSHQTLNFNANNAIAVLPPKNFSSMMKKSITIKRQ